MATERAEFELHLDDRPFQQSMARARGATVGLTDSVNKAGASIGAAATSVSGLNTALGGAVGSTNNLIGAAGNLATTFAAAGPVGLAIAAATTGIGLLIDAWQDAQEEARKTAEASKKAAEQMANSLENTRLDLAASALGVSTDIYKIGKATQDAYEKFLQLEADAKRIGLTAATVAAPGSPEAKIVTDLRAAKKEAEDLADLLAGKQFLADGGFSSTSMFGDAPGAKGASGRAPRAARAAKAAPEITANGLLLEFAFADRDDELKRAEEAQKKALKAQEDAAREREKIQRDMLRNLDKADDEYRRAEDRRRKKALEEEKKALEERMRYAEQQTLMFANAASSTVESVGMMLIKGQENVLGAVLDLVAQQVGGIIVGYGMEVMAGAVPKFFNPATIPVGIAQAAAGSALIGAGVGVRLAGAAALESGAVGSFIPNISAPGLNAGANGGADVTPISSGGVGRSSSAPSGSGGGLTIVVNNGIGMSSEDTQRAVVAAYREGQRRGFR